MTPDTCPDCGYPLPRVTITRSTIPVEVLSFCPNCPSGADKRAKWAEHYDGEILTFPPVDIGDAA